MYIGTALVLKHIIFNILFLECDAFIRTNRRAIAMMFVLLGWACVVIIRCTLAQFGPVFWAP